MEWVKQHVVGVVAAVIALAALMLPSIGEGAKDQQRITHLETTVSKQFDAISNKIDKNSSIQTQVIALKQLTQHHAVMLGNHDTVIAAITDRVTESERSQVRIETLMEGVKDALNNVAGAIKGQDKTTSEIKDAVSRIDERVINIEKTIERGKDAE